MAHLINKSALVAEIESHIREIKCITTPKNDKLGEGYLIGEESAYKAILSFLDTLEVKEVDEQKERMSECPYRQVGCTMYDGSIFECKGACNWVMDYLKLKGLEEQKESKV